MYVLCIYNISYINDHFVQEPLRALGFQGGSVVRQAADVGAS